MTLPWLRPKPARSRAANGAPLRGWVPGPCDGCGSLCLGLPGRRVCDACLLKAIEAAELEESDRNWLKGWQTVNPTH